MGEVPIPVFYETNGLTPQDWVTIAVGFGAAVLGALVGALVGGWISSRQIRQAHLLQLKRDKEENKARAKADLIKAQFQASLILTDATSVLKSIEKSLVIANDQGLTSRPMFMRLAPILGTIETPPIDLTSITPLIAERKNDVVRAYIEAHSHHVVLHDAIKHYNTIKLQLNDRVAPFATNVDGQTHLNKGAFDEPQLKPFFELADSLAKELTNIANDVRSRAAAATFGIGPAAKDVLKDPTFPILTPPKNKNLKNEAAETEK